MTLEEVHLKFSVQYEPSVPNIKEVATLGRVVAKENWSQQKAFQITKPPRQN
jgi:hypothetical protein